MQKRVKDFRPTWKYEVHQESSGNYYPVNGLIAVVNASDKRRFTLLNDRA
jgi:lysosomal alpha-mannosidase